MEALHTPVMLEEVILYLAPRKEGELMWDATTGEGGHTWAFLSRFRDLRITCIDIDPAIQNIAKERLKAFEERISFHLGWAQDYFDSYPPESGRPDTILIDLGISRFHYEQSGRGFSFRKDEELDMRLDPSSPRSAADLISRLRERELADLLYRNAGERYSRRIAKAIVEGRKLGAIRSSRALAELVERAVPPAYRRGPLHPATKTFQALRIAVNGELSRLGGLLAGALRVLAPGGRLGVLSFHSLEDRVIKDFFRLKNRGCTGTPEAPITESEGCPALRILTPKGIAPGEAEKRANAPSRSARLRVAEKLLNEDGEP
ncbi:MAG: 16S rRNA (cytosine(1402)-N(4))-methyltransferase RsmH [Treponema sp.]|jgi:16S rRNA (cytosine1402-N4)-methyltransferase|nr:16S rRNA (cytosine(1402)-N(4))-methyltransferase RsmH [Treponema sp.]